MTAPLEQRLKTLMAVRLVMVTTLLLVAAYTEAVSEYLLPFNPFYVLIGAIYAHIARLCRIQRCLQVVSGPNDDCCGFRTAGQRHAQRANQAQL